MIDKPTAPVIDRRARDRRHVRTFRRIVLACLPWIPLVLIVLSLAGLVITPMVLRERTRSLRADVREVAEPARLLLNELRLGLARELSLAQRFALAPESNVWFAYHRTSVRDDSLLARLDVTLREIGPRTLPAMAGLREKIEQWRQLTAMDQRRAPEDFMRQSTERGAMYEDLLRASLRVDTAVANAMQARRARVERSTELQATLGIVFVLLGCIALAAVLALTIRGRKLEQLLRRRAEEEESLRRLASTLSGAFTISEVAQHTINAALNSSRVGGAYVARALDGELVVVSGAGSCKSATGSHAPMPGWLTDRRNRDHPRIYTTEVHARHGPGRPEHNGSARSLLIVPLRHEDEVIGTLGVASAGGRRQLGDSAVRFGRALGDLAAVAMHRAEALDRERQARNEAEAAVKTRDAVVSIVSHDLRNPLMAIIGSSDLLLEMMRDGDERNVERAQVAMLKHAADGMHRLIRDLLDVTKLQSGPLPIRRTRLSIRDVVDDVMRTFQLSAKERRVTLQCESSENLPVIAGDRDRLAQVLWNLVDNALKFSSNGGQVTIKLDAQPPGVRLSVSDTGSGIRPEDLPHLFDRFWQASRHDGRGLGLGLSIVKAVVEAHGGTVDVESTLHKGSTFRILLPAADGQVEPSGLERARHVAGNGSRTLQDVPTIPLPTPNLGSPPS
jgi:signal transduction histidine kinase